MEILIGLVLALVLLYGWLSGWWFARVVMFLVLTVVLGLGFAALMSHDGAGNPGGFVVGGLFAWLLAAIPACYYRRRAAAQVTRGFQMLYPHWTAAQIADATKPYRR